MYSNRKQISVTWRWRRAEGEGGKGHTGAPGNLEVGGCVHYVDRGNSFVGINSIYKPSFLKMKFKKKIRKKEKDGGGVDGCGVPSLFTYTSGIHL